MRGPFAPLEARRGCAPQEHAGIGVVVSSSSKSSAESVSQRYREAESNCVFPEIENCTDQVGPVTGDSIAASRMSLVLIRPGAHV